MTAVVLPRSRRLLIPAIVAVVLAIAAGGFWIWNANRVPPPPALAATALPKGFQAMDPPLAVGDLKFLDGAGNTVRLGDFKGQPVLLNIWAKWCAPCLAEMPKLDKLQGDVAPGTLAIVTVAVDEPEPIKVVNFLQNRRWHNLKPYLDPKNVFADALNIKEIPTTLLIDKNGFALVRVDGPVDWFSDEAIRLLQKTIM